MADFRKAVKFVLEKEGHLSNDSADEGGLTKFGISTKAYPDLDIRGLTKEQAIDIYRRDYWEPQLCGLMEDWLAIVVFGTSVIMGVWKAAMLVQQSINMCGGSLVEDGDIGPKTIAAVKQMDQTKLGMYVLAERLKFCTRLCRKKPSQKRFLSGWVNRVADLILLHHECE